MDRSVRVGVLALQGGFAAHAAHLADLAGADRADRGDVGVGVAVREVRRPADLASVDALVMPGGESTTMSRLLSSSGLFDAISLRLGQGMPVFGTCAGMILLASGIHDGRADQRCFGALDITVRRNGYGRQLDSFETDIDVTGLDSPFHGVFIRAPRVDGVGAGVEVLARHQGDAVLVRQGPVMAAAFHPELTADARLHELFLALVHDSRTRTSAQTQEV